MSPTQEISEFDKLWNYNNPEDTAVKFREIIPKINDTADKSAYLQLLTQLARTQSLQLKFEEAHKILDEVEPQLADEMKLPKIRYLLERGRTYNSSKQKEKALELFLQAFELGKDESDLDFYTVDAAHMMGIAESPEEGIKWNEKGIELAENSKDDRTRGWLGAFYNNTGWTYHDEKKYDKALELFEKNVKWHTEKKSGQQLMIAKYCVGRTLRSLGRIDEAMKIHNDLLKEISEKKLEEDGYIYEELGECNLIKGNNEESKKNFATAYEMLSEDKWLAEYEKDRLDRMKELSA
ncbi:MAG: hypothetical protein ABIY50_08585 [Ignavibacteria bacterium]